MKKRKQPVDNFPPHVPHTPWTMPEYRVAVAAHKKARPHSCIIWPDTPDELARHQILSFMDGPVRKLLTSRLASNGKTSDVFPPSAPVANKSRIICDDGATMRAATIAIEITR